MVVVNDTDISYGKSGIPGLIGSPYVFGAALLASLGGFSFGYDQGVISIINVMPQFHAVFPRTETAFGKSFMTGMLELGAFIGCLFMPALADRISRKWALTVAVVIFNIGAIMQTAAPNYAVLVAGRTIGGVGVGTLAMVRVTPCFSATSQSQFSNSNTLKTGCTYIHIGTLSTEPSRYPTSVGIYLYRIRRRYLLLYHLRHASHRQRGIFPTSFWSTNGQCHISWCRTTFLSLFASMARPSWSQRRMSSESEAPTRSPGNRSSRAGRVQCHPYRGRD